MPATKRPPLVILGWQSWSILAVVLVLVIAAAVWIMLG